VIEAFSGKECIQLLESGERPDLILLDVMMPDMDGWETCKRIRENEKTRELVVAMLTVRDKVRDKIRSLEFGEANWHISKPLDKAKFVSTVEWLLTHPKDRIFEPEIVIDR
jgi:CheY-like chemotaxis protein